MKKLLLLAAAASLMAACAQSPTAPGARRPAPSDRPNADLQCRSGYVVAYDENGEPYCAPDSFTLSAPSRPAPRP